MNRYQVRLLVLLAVATFFEGYDLLALTQILPNLRSEMALDPSDAGNLVAFVNLGTIFSYFLVRKADEWGRRRVLMLTLVGYTVFSILSGLATSPLEFGLSQFVARFFLISEWAVANIYAAEEFPATKRAWAIGLIQGSSTLGAIACAASVPLFLKTALGWRAVYFAGAVPLLLVSLARRNLAETQRFKDLKAARSAAGPTKHQGESGPFPEPASLFRIFRTPYAGRVWLMASIWALTYAATQAAVLFWKEFAVGERGLTDTQVGLSISISAVAAIPLVFGSGWLLERLGRHKGATIIYLLTVLGIFGAYTFDSHEALTFSLVFAIFGSSAVLPVLNSYTAEVFPTELRADGYSWSNSLLGRAGYVLPPILIGWSAEAVGWGPSIRAWAALPLLALALILLKLPETRGMELEELHLSP